MIDRLEVLNKIALRKGLKTIDSLNDSSFQENNEVKEFNNKLKVTQSYIRKIIKNTEKLKELKSIYNTAISGKENTINNEIDQAIADSIDNQKKANILIQQIDEFIKEANELNKCLEQEKRIFNNLYGALIKYFQNAVNEFSTIQNDIKKMKQSSILRNAEIMLNRKIEDKEKEEILNNPNALHDKIKARLSDTAHVKLQNAFNDIQERSNDLTRLEKSMKEVTQLFMDLSSLVKLQGEIIDNIESNIKTAKNAVFSAEEDIIKSKKNMISARKKKCCIMVCVIVILVVICSSVLGIKLGGA